MLPCSGKGRPAYRHGASRRKPRAAEIHDLEMKVRLGGVAGVATFGHDLAPMDALSATVSDGPSLQMGEQNVRAVLSPNDEVVPHDPWRAEQLPDTLEHEVGHRRERRSAPVVPHDVDALDHDSVNGCPHRSTEPVIVLRSSRQRPPGRWRAGGFVGVEDEVDGVGLGPSVDVMARHTARRAVGGFPPPVDRRTDVHGRTIRRTQPNIQRQCDHEQGYRRQRPSGTPDDRNNEQIHRRQRHERHANTRGKPAAPPLLTACVIHRTGLPGAGRVQTRSNRTPDRRSRVPGPAPDPTDGT